jgi:hypothetical protein
MHFSFLHFAASGLEENSIFAPASERQFWNGAGT